MSQQASVTPSRNHPSSRLALKLPKDFQASLDTHPAAPALGGGWRCSYSQAAWEAWTSAAIEFGNLPSDQGHPGLDVTLGFRDDVAVRHIRKCYSDDEDGGYFFHAYLFTVPGCLQVAVWIEDDQTHAFMAYRGASSLVEEIGCQLKLFEGHCFTEALSLIEKASS